MAERPPRMTGTTRGLPAALLLLPALLLLATAATARAAGAPIDSPATLAERDALIDKIARGEDVERSLARFAALVHERDRVEATSQAAKEAARQAALEQRDWQEAHRKSADYDLGWRCTLSVDPKHPVPSTESRYRADWGRVVRRDQSRLPPRTALDEGELVVEYEVAGQARRYRFRGERMGRDHRAFDAAVGDLVLVCAGERDGADGELLRSGFAARIAALPRIVDKQRWNPIHVTRTAFFWAIRKVLWPHPPEAFVLASLPLGPSLGGGRWEIPVENKESFVVEVPPALARKEALVTGHDVWLILGNARFDRALKKLVLTVADIEPRYVADP
jgi:hypothetical protein